MNSNRGSCLNVHRLCSVVVLFVLFNCLFQINTTSWPLTNEKISPDFSILNKALVTETQSSELLTWGYAEILGEHSYTYRTTIAADWFGIAPFTPEQAEKLRAVVNELHSMGVKYMGYFGFLLSMSPTDELLQYYPEFSPENAGFIDLDGNPVINGYDSEGRPLFYPSIHRPVFQKMLFSMINYSIDADLDSMVFDVPNGMLGNLRRSFDNDTLAAFRSFLANKYTADELLALGVENVTTFDFAQYLRDLGYTASTLPVDGPTETNASILWKDWAANDALMYREFFGKLYVRAKSYAAKNGRDFKIFMNHGILPLSTAFFISQYYDGIWTEAYQEQEDYPLTSLFPSHYKIFRSLEKMFATMTLPQPLNPNSTTPDNWLIAISDIYASGGRIAQPLDDTLTPYFMLVSSHPELFGGQADSDVAVLFSVPTYKFDLYSLYGELMWDYYIVSPLNYERGNHLRGFESLFYLFRDSGLTFDTLLIGDGVWVNKTLSLDRLQKYEAVLIPDLRCVSDDDANVLLQYASNGGTLMAMGFNIGMYDEAGNAVNRPWFTELFNGSVIDYGNGTINSLLNATWIDYRETKSQPVLDMFKAFMNETVTAKLYTDLSEVTINKWWKPADSSMIFHLVNHKYNSTTDRVTVQENATFSFALKNELLDMNLEIKLYSPEKPNGIELHYAKDENGWINITIPNLKVWGILQVRKKPALAPRENWIITASEVVEGKTIILNGDLIVNSSLQLINSVLRVNGTSDRHFKITVYEGGSLELANSTITSHNMSNSYYIKVEDGARFVMEDSQISFAGVQGAFYAGGIWIATNDTMILNSTIHDNYLYGVYIKDASNIVILHSTVYNSGVGIYLDNASTAKIVACTEYNTDTATIIWRSQYVSISSCQVTNNTYFGIRVWKSNWVHIDNSLIGKNTIEGVTVWHSPFTTVFNNTICTADSGIAIRETSTITVLGNIIYNATIGLYLERTGGPMPTTIYPFTKPPLDISIRPLNTIVGNRLYNNTYGVYLYDDSYNLLAKFYRNDIRNNDYGLYFVKVKGTETTPIIFIFQNNFVGNEYHWTQIDSVPVFQFDNTTHGNFWDNYSSSDDDGDGIGDAPYQLDGAFDYYPLMEPVDIQPFADNFCPNINTTREVLENGTLLKITAQVTDQSSLLWTMINWTLESENRKDPIYITIVYFPDMEVGSNEFQMLPPETVKDERNVTFTLFWNLGENFTENNTRNYRIYSVDMLGNWGEWPVPPNIEDLTPSSSFLTNVTSTKFAAKVSGIVKEVILLLDEQRYDMSLNEETELYEVKLTLAEGTHRWYLTAKDDLGRTDITPMRKITVDTIIPTSEIIVPSDRSYIKNTVVVEVRGDDTNFDLMKLYLNETLLASWDNPGNKSCVLNTTQYPDGIYYLTLKVKDKAGNVAYSIIQVAMDNTAPQIIALYHHPETPLEGQEVKVFVNITDMSGVKNATILFKVNDGEIWFNATMSYNSSTRLFEGTIPEMPAGTTISYIVVIYDNLENVAIGDNEGEYYIYTVIHEFPTLTVLLLSFLLFAIILILTQKPQRFNNSSLLLK